MKIVIENTAVEDGLLSLIEEEKLMALPCDDDAVKHRSRMML
jgi:hypothetical protein